MTQPLLSAQGLVKRFGGLVATDHASFEVRAGEIHALIGPNGAGKTTLINQLCGALAPDAGRLLLEGEDISHWPMHRRALAGLVRSYQITSVFQKLSALDNVGLALQARTGSSWQFWRPARLERQRYEQAAQLLEQVGLSTARDRPASALSHGEQRQLEVGLTLALKPRVLLLDEPMAGVGPQESERMLGLLQGLRGYTSLLLVEHDMDAVFRLADRITVLVSGRVMASGTPHEIANNADVRQAYLGDESVSASFP